MDKRFTLTEASGDLFVNREEVVSDMVKSLSTPEVRMGYALYGIRRIGKSSIMREVERRLKLKKGVVPVYVNLWDGETKTVTEFVELLMSETLRAYESVIGLKRSKPLREYSKDALRMVLEHVKLEAKLLDVVEVLLRYSDVEKPQSSSIREALEAIDGIARETNTHCVLFLDEFPSIMDLVFDGKKIGPQVIQSIRTTYGQRLKNTVFVIAGSTKSTMNSTVLDKTSPFYRQLIIREIKPLEKKFVRDIIQGGVGWEVTDGAVEQIYEFTKGIPFYVQFIGRQLYMHDRKRTDENKVREILGEFLSQEANLIFLRDMEDLTPNEMKIVTDMAVYGITKASEIAKKHRQPQPNIYTYIRYLTSKGVLEKVGRGEYDFVDPIFKRWIKMRYSE